MTTEFNTILTIAIPTYNRAPRLQNQIARLLPQLNPSVRLSIFDNASTDATRQIVEGVASEHIKYVPSTYNGGAGWNFLRCIGEIQSKWVWILSDDDPVSANAVAGLMKLLENQDCAFIHAMPDVYPCETEVSDIPHLFQKTQFNWLLWISTCIYRVDVFRPLLDSFSESIFTWAPQVVVVLRLLESQKGKVLLSPLNLFGPLGQPASWSPLDFLLRVSVTPELMEKPSTQKLLAEDLLSSAFTVLLLRGLKETKQPGGVQKWKRIHRQAFGNLTGYSNGGILKYVAKNGFRAGNRRIALRILRHSMIFRLLNFCPDFAFGRLAKLLINKSEIST